MTRPIPSQPQMTARPGRVDYRWPEEGIHISIRRLHQHSDGRVTGHIQVRSEAPLPPGLLHRGDLNLSATRSKRELAKALLPAPPLWDWGLVLELVCDRTLNYLEEGEPVVKLFVDPEELVPSPAYLLHPLMPLGMPTIIYGEGGAVKSTLAIGLALCALLPWEENPFGLVPPPKPAIPLILDWEMDETTARYRASLFLRGHGLPAVELPYRRCYLPLAQDLEHIQDIVADTGATHLIVDSLGLASGGDLNTSQPPLGLFPALRQLQVTPLIIAHSGKDGDRGIYGNIHFNLLARSVWECRKSQEVGSPELTIALIDRKANLSGTRKPLGLHFVFDDSAQTLVVSPTEAMDVPGVLQRMSIRFQILETLKKGAAPVADLIDAIGKEKAAQVRNRLTELKRSGYITLLPNQAWALTTDRTEHE